jgi:hypothetical protein
MAILTQRKTWRRPETPRADRGAVLTQEERRHVAAALVFLKRRYGSWADLAVAMDMREKTVAGAAGSPRRIGPGVALRVAALAQVPAGEVLGGRWPAPGTCPICGGALPTPTPASTEPAPAEAPASSPRPAST